MGLEEREPIGPRWRWLLLVLAAAVPSFAHGQGALHGQGFRYFTNGGTVLITGYEGSGGAVTIPAVMDGYPVVDIGAWAFVGATNLASITIPDTVTNIADKAFMSCTGLTNVAMGDGVISLGVEVFAGCSRLRTASLSASLTNIGNETFVNCASLENVAVPVGVRVIGASAFSECISLKDMAVPEGVLTIGSAAFHNCAGLTNATLPGTVTNIGSEVFFACSNLLAVTVNPLNPAYRSLDGVLFDKSLTTLIQYPGGRAGAYRIPCGVGAIGVGAVACCTGLTNVTLPNSVTNIGRLGFAYSWRLTQMYCEGAPPSASSDSFGVVLNRGIPIPVTVYYLPAKGWDGLNTFGFRPIRLWHPRIASRDSSFGVGTNGFGFRILWGSGMNVVIQASTNLATRVWVPVRTNTVIDGTADFTDPQWTNQAARYYRAVWR